MVSAKAAAFDVSKGQHLGGMPAPAGRCSTGAARDKALLGKLTNAGSTRQDEHDEKRSEPAPPVDGCTWVRDSLLMMLLRTSYTLLSVPITHLA